MKKIICTIILCVACIFSLYGCSDKNDDGNGQVNKNTGTVIGKIEAIEGNRITLALVETDGMFGENGSRVDFSGFNGEMPENFNSEDFSGELPDNFSPENFDGTLPEGFNPENFSGEMPEGFDPESFNGERPEGTDGSRPDFQNGEMPENFMPQAGGMMNFDSSSLTYSGETATYTVPEGMKIGDGDYTSLKVDDVIMISFDNEGGISEIMVLTSEKYEEETTAA